jgi:transcriptional regulator of acetoin/glycerol metabolism
MTPSQNFSTAIPWRTEQELRSDWQTFIEKREVPTTVDPLVARSWMRCLPRLNPFQPIRPARLYSSSLLDAHEASLAILSIGRRVLEDVYQYVENTHSLLLLVNSIGYIVDLVGDNDLKAIAAAHGFIHGALISENQIGTNAFSLALTEGVPARVRGAEHFLQVLHYFAAAAAPVFDLTGRIMGAAGILTLSANHHPHSLGMAVASALAITGERQADLLLAEQNSQVTQLNALLSSVTDGIMVWNGEGRLININEPAEKILNMPGQALRGQYYRDFFLLPPNIEDAIQNQVNLQNVEVNVRLGSRPIDLVISARFVSFKNELRWVIVTLRSEANAVHKTQTRLSERRMGVGETITGNSPAIRRLRSMARTAAAARASILIRGERGTGKNTLALAIHSEGPRSVEPFVNFPCASIPPNQMIAELLGDEDGNKRQELVGKPGKFELARAGTLYFQDIDAMTLEAQSVLVDALDMGIIQRSGNWRPVTVDVRIMASTSLDLEKLVFEGKFRNNLYYRLSAFDLWLPPLRDRLDDLPHLAEAEIRRLSAQLNEPLQLSDETLQALRGYSWPGNLRELQAVLGWATSRCQSGSTIMPQHLPDFIFREQKTPRLEMTSLLVQPLREMEREAFVRAARQTGGNVSQMARVLGISRTTLWRRLQEFDIVPGDFREANKRQ